MTTSESTTFSPSRRSTTRSTPCVLGCCGPMLMTSSSVSNIDCDGVTGAFCMSISCVCSDADSCAGGHGGRPYLRPYLCPLAFQGRLLLDPTLLARVSEPQPVLRVFQQ